MGLGFFLSIIVGGLAGWIATTYMKANTGIIANVILGILGATVLNAVLGWIGIYAERSFLPQLIVGAAGAAGLIAAYRRLSS